MLKKLLPVMIAFIVSGCVAVPNLESPSIELQNIQTQHKEIYQVKRDSWWTELNNVQLNKLMDIVLDNNKDLKLLNIKIAKIQEQYALANTGKNVGIDFSATAKKQRLSGNSFNPPEYSNRLIDNQSLSLNTSYDIDLFDRVGHTGNQYMSLKSAEEVNRQWTALTISNQVVKLYAQYTFLNNQEKVLQRQADTYQELLLLEEYKLTVGKGVQDDVLKLKNNLKDMDILLSKNDTYRQLAINSLVMLGNNSSEIKTLLNQPTTDLYKTKLNLPTYYTASVIVERPDVKYYLYTIKAQEEKLKALKADFYPNITIDGSAGFETITPNLLLSKSSLFATIAPTLKLPIFDSGRITSNYKLAGLDLNTFVENYNQTLTTAVKDINDNLYKLHNEETVLSNTLSKYENKKIIFNNMSDRYSYGTISRYEYVQERDQLLNEERNANEQMFNRFNQQIDLINSLGGINITNANAGA